MKHFILSIAIILSIVGCGSTPSKPSTPTKFEADKKIGVPEGCYNLKREVEKYNKENPDKPQKVADC